MNKFKKLIISGHTQRKEYLQKLYTDRQVYISSVSSSMQPVEDEKLFSFNELTFSFEGTGYRTIEKMVLYVLFHLKLSAVTMTAIYLKKRALQLMRILF